MKVSELLRLLRDDGWFLVAGDGCRQTQSRFVARYRQEYSQAGRTETKAKVTASEIRCRHRKRRRELRSVRSGLAWLRRDRRNAGGNADGDSRGDRISPRWVAPGRVTDSTS